TRDSVLRGDDWRDSPEDQEHAAGGPREGASRAGSASGSSAAARSNAGGRTAASLIRQNALVLVPPIAGKLRGGEIGGRHAPRTDPPLAERRRIGKPAAQDGRELADVVLLHDLAAAGKNLAVDRLAGIRDDRTAARERLEDADAARLLLARV